MEILVTGATGTIGSHLVKLLQAFGASFKAMVRSKENAQLFESHGFKTVMGDFNDPDSLDKAFAGIDNLFLLTSPSPNQVAEQSNALVAAQKGGIQKIVKVSAIGTKLDSAVKLFHWHAETEEQIRTSGINHTFLHPQSFMQNFFQYIPSIQGQNAIYAPMKESRIPMIDARDIGMVAAKILSEDGHEGKTYTLTGPEPISYQQIAELFTEQLGRPIEYVDIPMEAAEKAMLDMGMPNWLVSDLIALNQGSVNQGTVEANQAVKQITGIEATSFSQFLQDHLEIFKGQ
ncbi:MAG: SDR family oxidoreductase [Cyclobacteriaceae bacterium]